MPLDEVKKTSGLNWLENKNFMRFCDSKLPNSPPSWNCIDGLTLNTIFTLSLLSPCSYWHGTAICYSYLRGLLLALVSFYILWPLAPHISPKESKSNLLRTSCQTPKIIPLCNIYRKMQSLPFLLSSYLQRC